MAFHFGPRMVRDGLILHLDAADITSYPGSGTDWNDLATFGYTHTVVGSPTFANKEFTLDGATQGFYYGKSITSSTTCTVVTFYKTVDDVELWVMGVDGGWYLSASYGNNYYHSNCGSPTNYVDLNTVVNPTTPINYRDGKYHMWEAKNVDFSAWTIFNWFSYSLGWHMAGTVSTIMVYNRALTAAESLQNYKAFKGRYGLS